MADSLRWPKIMPAWCYRDPATIGDKTPLSRAAVVPHETTAPAPRDRYYTQARRLRIQQLMRGGR